MLNLLQQLKLDLFVNYIFMYWSFNFLGRNRRCCCYYRLYCICQEVCWRFRTSAPYEFPERICFRVWGPKNFSFISRFSYYTRRSLQKDILDPTPSTRTKVRSFTTAKRLLGSEQWSIFDIQLRHSKSFRSFFEPSSPYFVL